MNSHKADLSDEEQPKVHPFRPVNGTGELRSLPHDDEAENALIADLFIDPLETLAKTAEKKTRITPDSFYQPTNKAIFRAALDLKRRDEPIDQGTIAHELIKAPEFTGVDIKRRIVELSLSSPTTALINSVIKTVHDLHFRREIIRSETLTIEEAYDQSVEVPEIAANLKRRLETAIEPGGGAQSGKGFVLWRPSQFIAHQPDPSACLLGSGYLELGVWTSLIGIGGLGKTRLSLWLVIAQILGKPWMGIPTHGTPQRSVILSTENGLRRWKTDLSKILAALTPAEQHAIDNHLLILAMTPDEEGDMCLGNTDTIARLRATLKACNPGIIVFDPFADMVEGDENKTQDLVQTLTTLRGITRSASPNAAVLIIHHGRTGSANVAQAGDNFNAGNFGRGAKALYSKVRCEIQLAPEDRDNPDRLVLACGKANDTIKFSPRCIVFDPQNFTYSVDPSFDIDAWRDDVSGKRKKSSLSVQELVEFVHEKCPLQGDETDTKTVLEHFSGSGAAERTIKKYIADAIDSNYLRRGKKRWNIRLGNKPLPGL